MLNTNKYISFDNLVYIILCNIPNTNNDITYLEENYCFKSCDPYIVVLQKLENTITNENRQNILDYKCAKFRANYMKTILIIHKYNGTLVEETQNTYYINKLITYKVGEIVNVDNFYEYPFDKVCGAGIHYFRSIKPAYFLEFDIKKYTDYSGIYLVYYDSGLIKEINNIKNGKLNGEYIDHFDDGTIRITCNYIDGQLDGELKKYYPNGKLAYCYLYHNNILTKIIEENDYIS